MFFEMLRRALKDGNVLCALINFSCSLRFCRGENLLEFSFYENSQQFSNRQQMSRRMLDHLLLASRMPLKSIKVCKYQLFNKRTTSPSR